MFKVHVELLAKSLADYADYLAEKNKHMKNHHSACNPSRQVEDNLSISFIPVSASRPSQLDTINQALAVSSELDIIELSTFSPIDPRQKYRYIQKLSEGLCVPAALLTYSAGGNVGNIVAVFRLPDKGEQMSICLPVIERFANLPHSSHAKSSLQQVWSDCTKC